MIDHPPTAEHKLAVAEGLLKKANDENDDLGRDIGELGTHNVQLMGQVKSLRETNQALQMRLELSERFRFVLEELADAADHFAPDFKEQPGYADQVKRFIRALDRYRAAKRGAQ